MNNKIEKLNLHEHNKVAYEKVKKSFQVNNRCCVIHPTGTGKSFISLALIADHLDDNILYVTSYAKDLQQFESKMNEYLGDCENVDTCLYSGLQRIPYKDYKYIILNEMHRAGATEWERFLKALLKQLPDAKILGLTATPIRYLDDNRNMAEELFDGNIASEITLQDAILQGLLPVPHYITGVFSYEEDIRKAEQKLLDNKEKKEYTKAKCILEQAKRNLELSKGIDQIFREKMEKTHGKYLVFCRNYEHMQQMMEKSREWFSWLDTKPHLYQLHSLDHDESAFSQFLNDESDTLRLLFCINMLNEGVHAPGIDGVICFRPTESLNVYLQQIGRALCTGNAEHPYIFDIVNNAEGLAPVQDFWNGVIQSFKEKGQDMDCYFEVYSRDVEISDLLEQFSLLTASASWDDYYRVCKKYAEKHGSLIMSQSYEEDGLFPARWLATQRRRYTGKIKPPMTEEEVRLLNEIGMDWDPRDVNGRWEYWYEKLCEYKQEHGNLNIPSSNSSKYKSLYTWTNNQRYRKSGKDGYPSLSSEQIDKLNKIGFEWQLKSGWDKAYEIAEAYYQRYGHLNLKKEEKYQDFSLGSWIAKQRASKAKGELSTKQIQKLDRLHMNFEQTVTKTWDDIIQLLVEYKTEYGTINMPAIAKFKGYGIGNWISKVRSQYRKGSLSTQQIEELEDLGIIWDTLPPTFEQMLVYAEEYYTEYGNLRVPCNYATKDGIKLGNWISLQRRKYTGKATDCIPLNQEQIRQLEEIGMEWNLRVPFETMYAGAQKYYTEHGNLDLSQKAVVNGLKLGSWISEQKRRLRDPKKRSHIPEERLDQLKAIGLC